MEYSEANTAHRRYTIGIMGEYQQEDTRGKRVAWARKRLGLKAKQLAAQVGIGYIYLSKIENDNANPTPDVMRKLAAELRVSRAFLEMETAAPDTPHPADAGGFFVAPTPRKLLSNWVKFMLDKLA